MKGFRKHARTIFYGLLAALVFAQAFWDGGKQPTSDDVEISAARRIVHTVTAEDALY
jgi:hypothetical protein